MTFDKILVVVVTYNNPVLLQHVFESYKKYDPGYPCDFLIVDHGENAKHPDYAFVLDAPNDRVEVSFDLAYNQYPDYKYYFFVHDDACANRNNWLKVFVDRMESNHVEDIIKDMHLSNLPIGRVGASTQFWRDYSSVLTPGNYSVGCQFLKVALDVLHPGKAPLIFKYSDNDRVLVSNECLKATNGIFNLSFLKDMQSDSPEKFSELCGALNSVLQYPDEGVSPKSLYPAGETWCKLLLLSEFMTSIETLLAGYRVTGLEGDGYLENIMGYDLPWGHNYIHHYGAPNFKQFMGRVMNSDIGEITKKYNNKIFLMKCDQAIKKYFKK